MKFSFKTLYRLFFCLSMAVFLTSCYSYRPVFKRAEVINNGIHKIENPALSFKLSPLGYLSYFTYTGGVVFGLIALSGDLKTAAYTGGGVGLATMGAVGLITAKKKVPNVRLDAKPGFKEKFISQYSKKHNLILENEVSDSYFMYIAPQGSYPKFTFITKEDVDIYRQLYPSRPPKEAIGRTLTLKNKFDTPFLLALLRICDDPSQKQEIGGLITLNAQSLIELKRLQNDYKVLTTAQLQNKAAQLVTNIGDFQYYKRWFNTTPNDDAIISKIIPTCTLPELASILNDYPTTKHNNLIYSTASNIALTIDNPQKSAVIFDALKEFVVSFPDAPNLYCSNGYCYLGSFKSKSPNPSLAGQYWDEKFQKLYRGIIINGQLNDENGVIYSNNDEYYKGVVKSNLPNGIGTAFGKSYYLGIDLSCDDKDNTGKYSGDWKVGYPDGWGRFSSCSDEFWYEGSFKRGDFHGKGTLRIPNGVRVEGNFVEGNPNGKILLSKWTLLGLVSKKAEGTAYSWAEVEKLQKDLLGEWSGMWSDAKIKAEKEKLAKCVKGFKERLTYIDLGGNNGVRWQIKAYKNKITDLLTDTDLVFEKKKDMKWSWKWINESEPVFETRDEAITNFCKVEVLK